MRFHPPIPPQGVPFAAALAAVHGVCAGCAASDFAALTGFPHAHCRVEVVPERADNVAAQCTMLGSAYGTALVAPSVQAPTTCTLVVTGDLMPDKSMLWYPAYATWYGRIVQHFPAAHVPAQRLVSVKAEN